MLLVEARHLRKTFHSKTTPVRAVDDVSFTVQEGETLGIVGGSGCGKSTLARLLCGLIPPDAGEFIWQGRSMNEMTRTQRARCVQMVFQDPYASLNPKLTVGTQLHEVSASPVPLLEAVGLTADALGHYPFQFSGGQRQRIAIARALALEPRLLMADEPLSALDVATQAQMLDLFKAIKARLGLTLIFITHDIGLAASFAERVLVLQEGRVVEQGPASQTLRSPVHPYTRALVDAVPVLS